MGLGQERRWLRFQALPLAASPQLRGRTETRGGARLSRGHGEQGRCQAGWGGSARSRAPGEGAERSKEEEEGQERHKPLYFCVEPRSVAGGSQLNLSPEGLELADAGRCPRTQMPLCSLQPLCLFTDKTPS